MQARGPIVLGRATTEGQSLPIDEGAIIAARAVRRALAAAKRRAADVSALVLAAPTEPGAAGLRGFARRALGPAGVEVEVGSIVAVERDAELLAALAAERLTLAPKGSGSVGVALGIDRHGRVVALCIASGARREP